MGTTTQIIVLPNLELSKPSLENALTELKTELDKLPDLKAKAEAIVCDNPAAYAELVKIVDQMEDIGKLGEEKMRPFLNVSNGVSEFLHAERKNQEQAAKAVFTSHKERAAAWKREERLAAEREQQRIRDEDARIAREKADAQRKADEEAAKERRKERVAEIRGMLKRGEIGKRKAEQLLREAGAIEEADKARAAADAEAVAQNVAEVQVQPNVPKVAGRRGSVNYFAEVTNGALLINAYIDAVARKNTDRAVYLRKFITVDESEVIKEAKAVKNSKQMTEQLPGCHFWDKDTV